MGSQLLPKRGIAPSFGSCLLWPNGWIEDATWYGSRPRPRPHCIKRGPSCPGKGHSSPPLFSPCLLWLLLSSCYFMWSPKRTHWKHWKSIKRATKLIISFKTFAIICLHCFDAVAWAAGRASGLWNWVVRYWHGYLFGARCKWFAYG